MSRAAITGRDPLSGRPLKVSVEGGRIAAIATGPESETVWLLGDGDTRWIHRAAYDLMDYRPEATESPSRIPRGISLYGSLPQQLEDPNSFVSRLADILRVRSHHRIATGVQVDPIERDVIVP